MPRKRIALLALVAAAFTLLASRRARRLRPLKKKPPKHHVKKKPKPKPGMNATQKLAHVKHLVVIYEENHSFDNLYGGWEGVNGRSEADARAHDAGQPGRHAVHLPDAERRQPDVAAAAADVHRQPRPARRSRATSRMRRSRSTTSSRRRTRRARRRRKRSRSPTGCSEGQPGLPGGCTRDLVHGFYQEQYQINGGAQNRYVTGSDAVGLTMGHYDTKQLPIYKYLHADGASELRRSLDNFFQAAFGGSFLNHQWLIAAAHADVAERAGDACTRSSTRTGCRRQLPAVHRRPAGCADARSRVAVPALARRRTGACGDYAVNTDAAVAASRPARSAPKLPLQTAPTIGDRLTAKHRLGVVLRRLVERRRQRQRARLDERPRARPAPTRTRSPASAYPNCPDVLFQFHHQPFNYFANYAPGYARPRAHLKDEAEFISRGELVDRRAASSRSASSSRSARRTSIPATRASRTAATTS